MSGNVYSSVDPFHKDARGIRATNLDAGPDSYANELARYIRCASTVRARTFDHYGRGPSIDAVRAMRQRHEEGQGRFKAAWAKLGHSDQDQWVRAAKPSDAKPEPVFIEPEPIKLLPCVTPADIIARIERAYRAAPGTIVGRSRARRTVTARNLAAYVLRQRGNSLTKVGMLLGGRDHSTVSNALERFEDLATPEMRAFAGRLLGESK